MTKSFSEQAREILENENMAGKGIDAWNDNVISALEAVHREELEQELIDLDERIAPYRNILDTSDVGQVRKIIADRIKQLSKEKS